MIHTVNVHHSNLELSVYAANEEEMEAKRAYLASLIGAQVALELYNHPYSTFLGTVSEMSNIEESVALGNNYRSRWHSSYNLIVK